jgi:hypothetical protein
MASQLLTPDNVCLQVIDVQEKLMAKIHQVERVTATVELMMRAAAILKLPVVANTQYAKGLGPYVGNLELLAATVPRFDKTDFNALANGETKRFFDTLAETVHTVACGRSGDPYLCLPDGDGADGERQKGVDRLRRGFGEKRTGPSRRVESSRRRGGDHRPCGNVDLRTARQGRHPSLQAGLAVDRRSRQPLHMRSLTARPRSPSVACIKECGWQLSTHNLHITIP